MKITIKRVVILPNTGIGDAIIASSVARLLKSIINDIHVAMGVYNDFQRQILVNCSSIDETINVPLVNSSNSVWEVQLSALKQEFDLYLVCFQKELILLDRDAALPFNRTVYLESPGGTTEHPYGIYSLLQNALCDHLDVPRRCEPPVISQSARHKRRIEEYLSEQGIVRYAVVSIEAGMTLKSLPRRYIDNFCELAETHGLDVLLVSEKKLHSLPQGIKAHYRSNDLNDVVELIRSARLFLGPDSMLLHVAAAVGTNAIGVYGPTTQLFKPPVPNIIALDKSHLCHHRAGDFCEECNHPGRLERHAGAECLYWVSKTELAAALCQLQPVYKGCYM